MCNGDYYVCSLAQLNKKIQTDLEEGALAFNEAVNERNLLHANSKLLHIRGIGKNVWIL
jgi:hypothetical protein